MSDVEQELVDKLGTMAKLANLLRVLLVCAAGFGGWVATLEYRHRHTDQLAIKAVTDLNAIALWKASTDASRFDAKQG